MTQLADLLMSYVAKATTAKPQSAKQKAQARWPKGAPNGKGGEWMDEGGKAAAAVVAHDGKPKKHDGKPKKKDETPLGMFVMSAKLGKNTTKFLEITPHASVDKAGLGKITEIDGKSYLVADDDVIGGYGVVPSSHKEAVGQGSEGTSAKIAVPLLYPHVKGGVDPATGMGSMLYKETAEDSGIIIGKTQQAHQNILLTQEGFDLLSKKGNISPHWKVGLPIFTNDAVKGLDVKMGMYFASAGAHVNVILTELPDHILGATTNIAAGKEDINSAAPRADFPHLKDSHSSMLEAHAALSGKFWEKAEKEVPGLKSAVKRYELMSSPTNDAFRGSRTRSWRMDDQTALQGKHDALLMSKTFANYAEEMTIDVPVPIYRGVSEALVKRIQAHNSAGRVWSDGGFYSTAMSPASSSTFAGGTILRMKDTKGIRAVPAVRSRESELILDHAYGYRVAKGAKVVKETFDGETYNILDVELVDLRKTLKTIKLPNKQVPGIKAIEAKDHSLDAVFGSYTENAIAGAAAKKKKPKDTAKVLALHAKMLAAEKKYMTGPKAGLQSGPEYKAFQSAASAHLLAKDEFEMTHGEKVKYPKSYTKTPKKKIAKPGGAKEKEAMKANIKALKAKATQAEKAYNAALKFKSLATQAKAFKAAADAQDKLFAAEGLYESYFEEEAKPKMDMNLFTTGIGAIPKKAKSVKAVLAGKAKQVGGLTGEAKKLKASHAKMLKDIAWLTAQKPKTASEKKQLAVSLAARKKELASLKSKATKLKITL